MSKTKAKNGKDKVKLSLGRIISNNLFMLRLQTKVSPWFLPTFLLLQAFSAFLYFLTDSYMLRYALNGIEEGKSFGTIALVLVGCAALLIIFAFANSFYWEKVFHVEMTKIIKYNHELAYKKAAELDLSRYENPEYYEKLEKAISEGSGRIENVNNSIANVVYRVITFSANFALLFTIDPMLMLFVLIPLLISPLHTLLKKIIYKRDMAIREEKRKRDYARRTFYMAEYSKEMRMSHFPGLMLGRFVESSKEIIRIMHTYGLKRAAVEYILEECNDVIVSMGAMLYAVWQTVARGNMGYGDCIVVVNSIEHVAWTLTNSANDIMAFQENALYIENFREFLESEPTIKSGDRSLPEKEGSDIVLENVSFRYDGASDYTLKNVNMRFGANEKVAIVGHNGAGKSTLVKLLLRLYDAEGDISYGGVPLRELDLEEYRDMFSAVMQDYHVFALTVSENVLLRRRQEGDSEIVESAIIKAGLAEKISEFENGVETLMTKEFDKNGKVMSGGQQQKLAISHAYSKQNRFVILDEPSSALDPIAEHDMYENMTRACEGSGMIFISHRLSSAVTADRIYLMENGSVAESGTHAELMARNGKYAEMFRRQAESYAEVSANG